MGSRQHRLKMGIIGCGAIGSRIAISTTKELQDRYMISALYDIDQTSSQQLAVKFRRPSLVKTSIKQVISSSDIIVEAVNSSAVKEIVSGALNSKKSVLVMSVGRLLDESRLFALAQSKGAHLLLPSGAIAGLDAIKAARLAGITSATLTSIKPPQGFRDNEYLAEKGMDLSRITTETLLFDGRVRDAIRYFPQNINVAAALSLAVGDAKKVRVRIVASPGIKRNIHEIVIQGSCGKIVTRVENEACPDNPKTSYLAVLSAISALRQHGQMVRVGI